MIITDLYIYIILSIAGGLLTLLGSVGIFISIIVQRRLDRLQEILEEFINLSYRSEINLTGHMYNLIEKYQMNYIFPQKPHFLILRYIDINIFFIILLWTGSLLSFFQPPLRPFLFLQLLPLAIGIYASFFFRRLLRNTLSPGNPLLETIIPSPIKMRSISYLSHYVNLSVKSILKQARLSLHLQLYPEKNGNTTVRVLLKEELSCDDFFYYLILQDNKDTLFISLGEIIFHFSPDPITGKPVPVCRNLNVPLGLFSMQESPQDLSAKLLIFTRGEKHPVLYSYLLEKGTGFFFSICNPDIMVNHQILYKINNEQIKILANSTSIPYFNELSSFFHLDATRYYLNSPASSNVSSPLKTCSDGVFID
ncbi:MAG: hypothetical protein CVU87_01585 [Firmicutes bacterium HGW-Firmicutes-12]|nr:MAG: hypothetical protein CVU87_01585 [Firmicutes bacterium HGW-Firmicutes-12]